MVCGCVSHLSQEAALLLNEVMHAKCAWHIVRVQQMLITAVAVQCPQMQSQAHGKGEDLGPKALLPGLF